jgi:hypothetical protein
MLAARHSRPWARPWWTRGLVTAASLAVLVAYSVWAIVHDTGWYAGSYTSPVYAVCIAANCGRHATLVLVGSWWRWSPAILVAFFPISFRFTCYHFRRVYYRAFWLSPPACAIPEPRRRYSGEARLPVALQNLHRLGWYAAVPIATLLTADAVEGFRLPAGGWGVGLGSLVLSGNAALFWLYCLSCHSCRHLVGGQLRHFSGHPVRYRLWRLASLLNARHGLLAWLSLLAVVLADLYVRLLAAGALTDPKLLG